jgi:hypothetical protein
MPITAPQVLWANMVISVALGLVIAYPHELEIMSRPPRSVDRPILTGFGIWRIIFVGLALVGLLLDEISQRCGCARPHSRRQPNHYRSGVLFFEQPLSARQLAFAQRPSRQQIPSEKLEKINVVFTRMHRGEVEGRIVLNLSARVTRSDGLRASKVKTILSSWRVQLQSE